MSGFRDTDEFEKSWNCRFKGSKKDKNLENFTPSDKSFIIGYYLGSRTFQDDKKRTHIVHKMHVVEIGSAEHSPALANSKGEIREFFGTTVLNKKLGEKITPGQFIKVLWLGKVTETKNGGDPYDDWKVLVDDSKAPFLGDSSSKESKPAESKKTETPAAEKTAEAAPAASTTAEEEDDDLPF